jgi:hypothetical protein
MKPQPAPTVPGDTDTQRFDNAVRKMFTVSKEDIRRHEAVWKRMQKRQDKKAPAKKP